MNFVMPDFALAAPEILLLGMAAVILVVDLFLKQEQREFTYLLAQLALFATAVVTLATMGPERQVSFGGSFVRDTMGDVLKIFLYVVTIAVFLYAKGYLKARGLFKGEFFTLGLFGVVGMMVMISAYSFLTVYLGLELLSLSLYALVAMQRDSARASEAAMKYFVLGAIASGMLLYGFSMLYGATGSLQIAEVGAKVASIGASDPILAFGLVFVVVGLAFKLGAVPFHMWLPDVYHGAPTAVTLYLGAAPKLAAFAMVVRLLTDGLGDLHGDWQGMLIILSILSLAIGNVVAIAQTNLKRMLAYSTISHVGYLMLGLIAGTPEGYAAAMYYTIIYALMAVGGFGMILLLSRQGFEAEEISDFAGLNERSPWFALMMLLLMFSMAGVPPTIGFYAKLAVLEAIVKVDLTWLAVVAMFFAIIGAFYYIRVVKVLYFDKPEQSEPLEADFGMRAVLTVNGVAMLLLGLLPGTLMGLCVASFA